MFDWTITLGNVLTIAAMIGTAMVVFHKAMLRLDGLEHTLKDHADTLSRHERRLDHHEDKQTDLLGELNRMIGRMETAAAPFDRRRRSPTADTPGD